MEIHEAYSEIEKLYEKAKNDYEQSINPLDLKSDVYEFGKKVAYGQCLKILKQIPGVIRLSNCPFCGGAAIFSEEMAVESRRQVPYLRVICPFCGVKTNKIKLLNAYGERDGETERVARMNLAKKWNKRK